jgi:GTP pyrophosphokinase
LGRELEAELSYITDPVKLARIGVALQVAYHCHLGQKRKSGEPFVHHPVAVAKILAQLRMDVDSIVAGLLHVSLLPPPPRGCVSIRGHPADPSPQQTHA